MRWTLWRAAYLLLFCGLLGTAWADPGRPSWVDRPPQEDSQFKYYIGRASELPSEAEAFRQATVNGREQAIGANFGIVTQIRSETYQSTETAQSTQTSEEISRQVRLEDFEQSDFYRENRDGKISVWILFKYRRAAIERERSRLASLKEEERTSFNLMESGDDSQALKNGTLEVVSRPAGAPVRIDGIGKLGDMELRTPLRLKGLFSAGKHTVEIDDSRYGLVSEEINLYPGTTARVDKALERAYGSLVVITDPPGAAVFLGTKSIGTSPISKEVKIMAEVPSVLEIRHPEMETYTTEIRVGRDESWHTPVKLIGKQSTLAVSSTPSGALVEIDGESSKTTPTGQITVARGKHRVRVSKNGYHAYETTVTLLGGEHKVLSMSTLSRIDGGLLKGLNHFDSDYKVTLNGKSLSHFARRSPATSSNADEITVNPGTYNLEIAREGYETYVASIEVPEGGETDISDISLKEDAGWKSFFPAVAMDLSLGLQGYNSYDLLGLGLAVRFKAFGAFYFGLEGRFGLGSDHEASSGSGSSSSNSSSSLSGNDQSSSVAAFARFYLIKEPKAGLYLKGVISRESLSPTCGKDDNGNCITPTPSTQTALSYGGGIGYQWLSDTNGSLKGAGLWVEGTYELPVQSTLGSVYWAGVGLSFPLWR